MSKPIVAIVGRPNVGKSTLFNRLTGARLAVVDEVPGTTRDRLHANAEWSGREFVVVDTGGIDPIKVTAGSGQQTLSIGSADFVKEIRHQAQVAIRDADAVLFLVDVKNGVTPADIEVAEILRREQGKRDGKPYPPVILVSNKSESQERRRDAIVFYELGMGEPYAISALHGTGTGDLLDVLVELLNSVADDEDNENEDQDFAVALVGKPNAGKSTLLNAFIGEERAIVSDIPGTTRDAVDSMLRFEDQTIKLIDTAGLRRRGRIEPGVERFSVIRTMRAIERADVALVLIDATSGITSQDAHIAGFVQDAWKSAILIVNKWDAIEKDSYTIESYKEKIRSDLKFIDYAPMLFISAKTGQRVNKVLPLAVEVGSERNVRLSTSQINKFIRDALDRHPPPTKAGRALKIYYGTQVRGNPPTFLFHVNEPKLMHFTYRRYLENRLREVHGFLGTPLRIVLRKRAQKER
jgi:GTP-binding protein